MTIRTLIVDDEEPARELLRSFLSQWPDVEIVAEAGDGAAAIELTRRHAPDLMFLDVQMPRVSGFDVVAALGDTSLPLIVFVTAYDQYALRAFEVSACDYLLKPFDADRLASTMRRVLKQRIEPPADVQSAIRALLSHVRAPASRQLVVKADGRHVFLDSDDVEWIEAVGKDVRLHLGAKSLVVRESMNGLASRLDPDRFVRVHRSAMVNRAHVREAQPWFKGDYVFIMKSGARVTSGRTYRELVRRVLEPRGADRPVQR
jgi:two-component system LytT family response regulator